MPESPRRIALVISGGGARGAYEAGIIHYLRTALPPPYRKRHFNIHCGASVGAINSAFMAATAHDLARQGREVRELWESVREEDIYRRDMRALLSFLSSSAKGVFSNIFPRKLSRNLAHFRGFLDTTPFLPYLQKIIPWPMITKNINAGLIDALSIVATNVFTGRMELFVQKRPEVEYTGEYLTHFTQIKPEHVMASAAIPIVFPTVSLNNIHYTDGGLRLNTPMSPAIQLGADALFVIGLHHRAKPREKIPSHGIPGKPPSMGQVTGRVFNSIFLDRIQYDLEQLERINRIIDWGEMLYGKAFLSDLNELLKKQEIRGDIANRGLKRLQVLRIRPSENVGELFLHFFKRHSDKHFTAFEKFLARSLDIDPIGGVDFLSYITFMPEYLKRLLELGFEDARRHHNQIKEFLEQ